MFCLFRSRTINYNSVLISKLLRRSSYIRLNTSLASIPSHIVNHIDYNEIISSYNENIVKLSEKYNFQNTNLSTIVNHEKRYSNISINDQPLKGSIIQFSNDKNEILVGLVLNELKFYLTNKNKLDVLLPNGEIVLVPINKIDFRILNFLDKNYLINDFNENSLSDESELSKLTFTLNVLLKSTNDAMNKLISKDILKTIYFKLSNMDSQTSVDFKKIISLVLNDQSIKNFLDINLNPFSLYSLHLACHLLIINDPIHFRFLKNFNNSIFNILNPLNQITTNYFLNPVNLSQDMLSIYLTSDRVLARSYCHILNNELKNGYQIFRLLEEDVNFKKLILLIKYIIVYPHDKLINKLKGLVDLPIITPVTLNDYLIRMGIYDESETNPILSSGIYGNSNLNLSSLKNLKDLELFSHSDFNNNNDNNNDNSKLHNIDITDKLLKAKKNRYKFNYKNVKFRSQIYKLSSNLAFSVNQLSLTKYEFNFLIPIPKYNISLFQLTNPINFNIHQVNDSSIIEDDKYNKPFKTIPDHLPMPTNFQVNKKSDQICIKLNFVHDLLDLNSIIKPNLKIEFDSFRRLTTIKKEWFNNRNPNDLGNNKKKLYCWVNLNKLSNLIKEKEKVRIKNGFLKTFSEFDNINSINNNYNGNNFEINEDYDWFNDNVKLIVNEYLSLYCIEKKIPVLLRKLNKINTSSTDFRIFKKFKIFKWYANSYDTFNFQLCSNTSDITSFVSCLKYLKKNDYVINNENGGEVGTKVQRDNGKTSDNDIQNLEFKPLGLKSFASFSDYNYLETYLNNFCLLNYLADDKKKSESLWMFEKCINNTNSYLEMFNRLKRFKKLFKLRSSLNQHNNDKGNEDKNGTSTGTGASDVNDSKNYRMFRCLILDPPADDGLATGYCFELDLIVKIKLDTEILDKILVGDRLICSKVLKIEPILDEIILH